VSNASASGNRVPKEEAKPAQESPQLTLDHDQESAGESAAPDRAQRERDAAERGK
jgi:hypothetical protein